MRSALEKKNRQEVGYGEESGFYADQRQAWPTPRFALEPGHGPSELSQTQQRWPGRLIPTSLCPWIWTTPERG